MLVGWVLLPGVQNIQRYPDGCRDGFVCPALSCRGIIITKLLIVNYRLSIICQSGLRSYIASRILEGSGYTAYNFAGGFRFYDAVMNDRRLNETAYPCGMDR